MKVAIFTPTARPGFDVTHASVKRQETDAEIMWIVGDLLFDQRANVFKNLAEQDRQQGLYNYKHFPTPKVDNNARSVSKAYNAAMYTARKWGANMFLSLQDYIYIPEDAVQKFIVMDQEIKEENLKGIYTGITSISRDPLDREINDLNGMYTIFKEPYYDRPSEIEWCDVRYVHNHTHSYHRASAIEFETNWACFPEDVLYSKDLFFDEIYDDGVAYENQDYAFRAIQQGFEVFVAYNNQAISLPHKRYFSEEWAKEEPLTEVNRKITEDRWVT